MEDSQPVMLSEEQLDAIIGGVNNALQNGLPQGGPLDIGGMDIETALMAVQGERTRLLDIQFQTQVAEVKERNNTVAQLNEVLHGLNSASGEEKPPLSLNDKFDAGKPDGPTWAEKLQEFGVKADANGNGALDKAEIDSAVQHVKGQLDAAGNSQHMDMLRLQSLSNKRNEAFDVMTNFVKKMQDSRSSIIGNMR
ncbi:hypothetical protein [Pararhizobium sp.]|uniref:hypothetical protein n=1 Tax=Pararhizobium sp. TaxID=1977563 RepID=UPI003D12770F